MTDTFAADLAFAHLPVEEPALRVGYFQVLSYPFQSEWGNRNRYIAVFFVLALPHVHQFAVKINVTDFQIQYLGDPEPAIVSNRKQHPVLQQPGRFQDQFDLDLGEHHRQGFTALYRGQSQVELLVFEHRKQGAQTVHQVLKRAHAGLFVLPDMEKVLFHLVDG